MIHLVLGETCQAIKEIIHLVDGDFVLTVEKACHHGFRWHEGASVAERGWQARTSPDRRACEYCHQALSRNRHRFCSTVCSLKARRRVEKVG